MKRVQPSRENDDLNKRNKSNKLGNWVLQTESDTSESCTCKLALSQ